MKIKLILLTIEICATLILANAGVDASTTLVFLLTGAVLGAIFKILWDLGQVRQRELKMVIIDVLANILIVGGLGLFAWYALDWYLSLTPKIIKGEVSLELVFATILAIGFMTVAGGRSGVRWVSGIAKTFIEMRFGKKNEQ